MKQRSLPFESGFRSFQRMVSWFMPEDCDRETAEAFKLRTIISVSLLVGTSGFPFMLLFFFMQHPREGFVVLWSWLFFMGIPFLVRRGWSTSTLAHLIAANYYQCHFFLLLIWGGVEAPNTMWFAAVPVVSVLVGSIAHGMIWGGIAAFSVLGVYAVELFEWVNLPTTLEPSENLFIVATGGAALLAAVFCSTTTFEILRISAFERRIKAETELLRANNQLKSIDAQKTSFFQNVSHELRTPLTLILPPLDEAIQARPEDTQMVMAARNARRLLRLVNQLLDLQKLRAGPQTVSTEPIDIGRFLLLSGDVFQSACAQKDIKFEVRVHDIRDPGENAEVWIDGETDALEKIVFNFLSNALKFTPSGGHISLEAHASAETVKIAVRDTGPGIATEDMPRLFKEFSQLDTTSTREYEGTGLGLALARSLAEQLGGRVGVESVLGEGSEFWVEFTRTDAGERQPDLESTPKEWLIDPIALANQPSETTSTPQGPADGELVLVVDDIADLRALVCKFMHEDGFRTLEAANGQRALELARAHRPDVIVTDWMMPVMSGPELIRSVKSEPDLSTVPVVLLTAKSEDESKLAGHQIGADSFLGKPFNAQELTSIVRNLTALKAREREVESLNRMLTETVLKRYLPPALIDRIISGELSMDKPAEMRTITILFSDLCGFTASSERVGPERMSRALNRYLSAMNEVIFKHDGTIDKFIGDAIMVLFGAPLALSPEEQVRRACECATEMQSTMAKMKQELAEFGLDELDMRIGIHHGDAVVGNFGSEQRSDYTAIGPTVNIASRIESACEPGKVFISDTVRDLLSDSTAVSEGSFDLKGIDGRKPLFSLQLEPHGEG